MTHSDTSPSRSAADTWAMALILCAVAAKVGFVLTGQLDLVQDEAQYWDWSRQLAPSYYSKGPLVAYIIAAGRAFFGDTQLGVRAGSILCGGATLTLVYLGMSRLFDRPWAGVWTVGVMASAPLFLSLGLLMTTDSPLTLCWATALFAVYAAGRGRYGIWPYVALALAMAVGILGKYMMLALVPVVLGYALLLPLTGNARPPQMLTKTALALALGVALGMAPILYWNSLHGWVGFKHVIQLAGLAEATGIREPAASAGGGGAGLTLKYLPDFLGSQVGLLTPWWLAFMFLGGWRAAKAAAGRGADRINPLDTPWSRDQGLLIALAFWPMVLIFLAWSLHSRVYGNWVGMAYVGGAVAAGTALAGLAARKPVRHWVAWPALGVLVFVLAHSVTMLPLSEASNPAARLMGFADLGRKLDELAHERFEDPDRVLYLGGSYGITSALAFYGPGQPTAYLPAVGRRLAQYDFWPGPGEEVAGYDAFFVRKKVREKPPEVIESMFDSVERLVYRTTHKGRPGRVFTIFLCKNFNGNWPPPAGKHF